MPKKQNQPSQTSDDIGQSGSLTPRAEANPQFERLANDQRELEQMLESMTDLENTHSEELATAWQSITDRATDIRKECDSLAESRSQLETETETIRQRQRELETLQNQLDAREHALDTREAELDARSTTPPGQGAATPDRPHGGRTDSTSEAAELTAWEARLNSRERELHERHDVIDRQSRYAGLEKSNLRAQRDELAVWNEQLQNTKRRLNPASIDAEHDANQQRPLASEWTALRSRQDDLQLDREDVERQRAEIDRNWLELESQIMQQHAETDLPGPDESPANSLSTDSVDDSHDLQSPPDWSTDFADGEPASTAESDSDLPLSVEDSLSRNTSGPDTPISLTDLFGGSQAAPTVPESEVNGDDDLAAESPAPPLSADDQKPPVEMTDIPSSTNNPPASSAAGALNNNDAAKTAAEIPETADKQDLADGTIEKSVHRELEEESIEAYMERLLSQSRSMTEPERRQTTQHSTDDPPASEKTSPENEAEVPPQRKSDPTTEPTVLTNSPVHEQDRDEVRAGLNSLRELANYSARSAIVSHTWRKHRISLLTKMLLVVLSFAILSTLSVVQFLPDSQNLIVRCALSGVGVAAMYALLNPIQSLHTLRQDRKRTFNNTRS